MYMLEDVWWKKVSPTFSTGWSPFDIIITEWRLLLWREKWTESLIASQQALIDRTKTLLVIQNKKYWLLHFILIHYQVYNWNILYRRVNLNSLSPVFYSQFHRGWVMSDHRPHFRRRHVPRLPRWFSFSTSECSLFTGWQTFRNVPEIPDHLQMPHGHPWSLRLC